jgi:large subunit ribosomal protein L31e
MKTSEIKIEEDLAHIIWSRGVLSPPRNIRVILSKTDVGYVLVSPYTDEPETPSKEVKEAPKETPSKEVKEAPKETPSKEAPKETPSKEAPKETPSKEAPKETPSKEAPKETPSKKTPKKSK